MSLTWLNQNKKYQGWAACQYSLIVGGYWILCRHTFLQTFRHGGLWGLLAEHRRINNGGGGYNLDIGRHHHYTAKPSHLLLSTFLSGLQQQRATLGLSGDVIDCGVCVCVSALWQRSKQTPSGSCSYALGHERPYLWYPCFNNQLCWCKIQNRDKLKRPCPVRAESLLFLCSADKQAPLWVAPKKIPEHGLPHT